MIQVCPVCEHDQETGLISPGTLGVCGQCESMIVKDRSTGDLRRMTPEETDELNRNHDLQFRIAGILFNRRIIEIGIRHEPRLRKDFCDDDRS